MRTYKIHTFQGVTGEVVAEDERQLKQKLATGHYGVMPIRGHEIIKFTPENITQIEDLGERLIEAKE